MGQIVVPKLNIKISFRILRHVPLNSTKKYETYFYLTGGVFELP
jgi:hypothetical protein